MCFCFPILGVVSSDLDTGVDLGAVLHEVDDTSRVSPLVVVPSDKLDEAVVEHDSGSGIEDRGPDVGLEVGGDEGLRREGRSDECRG